MNSINETLYASIRTHRILHLTSSSLSSGYKSFGGILWSSLSDDETRKKNPIVSASLSSTSFKEDFKSAPLSVLESLCWFLRNTIDVDTDGVVSARSVLIDAFVCVAAEWNRSQRDQKQEHSLLRMLRLLVNSICMNSANDSMNPVRFIDQSALRTSLCYCRDLLDHFVEGDDVSSFNFASGHNNEPEIVDTLLLASQLTVSASRSLRLRRVVYFKILSISMRTLVYHESAVRDVIRAAYTILQEESRCVLKDKQVSRRKMGKRCVLMFLQSQSFRRSCCGAADALGIESASAGIGEDIYSILLHSLSSITSTSSDNKSKGYVSTRRAHDAWREPWLRCLVAILFVTSARHQSFKEAKEEETEEDMSWENLLLELYRDTLDRIFEHFQIVRCIEDTLTQSYRKRATRILIIITLKHRYRVLQPSSACRPC